MILGIIASQILQRRLSVGTVYDVDWVNIGDTPTIITSTSVQLPGLQNGLAGANAGSQAIDLSSVASPGGKITINFDRTYFGNWWDEDFTDAQFVVYVFTDTPVATTLARPTGSWTYDRLQMATANGDAIVISMRKTETLFPNFGIALAGSGSEYNGVVGGTLVNAGAVLEQTGPVSVSLVIERTGDTTLQYDTYVDEVHRWTGTLDNANVALLDFASGCVVGHFHNYVSGTTYTLMENAQVIVGNAPPPPPEPPPPEALSPYPALIVSNNPTAYYRLGEASGVVVVDEINSPTQNGTIAGTINLGVAGAIVDDLDTAVSELTASASNYIQVPITLGFTTNDGMSIEAWVDWQSGVMIRDGTNAAGTGSFLLLDSTVNVACRIGGIDITTPLLVADYKDGLYHHWVIEYVHSTTTVNVYVDGALEHSQVISARSGTTVSHFRLFQNGGAAASHGTGRMDEVAFYDYPLGGTRVFDHFLAGTGQLRWTPEYLSTEVWFDASDSTTVSLSGANLLQINDKSGNNRHATPPATQPTYTATGINSMGSVVFGASQSIIQTPSFANPTGADGLMMVAVMEKTADPVTFPVPICKGAVNAEWSMIWSSTAASVELGRNKSIWRNIIGGPDEVRSTTDVGFDTPRVFSGIIANSIIEQYFTGSLEGSTGAGTRSFGGPSALTIGGVPSAGNNFQGRVGEVVLVHADITVPTRQRIEGYLAHKWGLAADLPVGHPYKNAPPTVEWNPADISTSLWLDAADPTTITFNVSDQVSVWNDKSGTNRNATVNRNPLPIDSDFSNGLPAVAFNNSRADFSPEVNVRESFVYFVGKVLQSGDGFEGQILSNSSRNHQLRFVGGAANIGVFGTSPVPSWGNLLTTTGMSGRPDQPVFAGVDYGDGKFYTLGSVDASDGGGPIGGDFFYNTLGARSVSSEYLVGAIAEVIICSRTEDRLKIEGYLAHKWGLAFELPADHPYKNAAPTIL